MGKASPTLATSAHTAGKASSKTISIVDQNENNLLSPMFVPVDQESQMQRLHLPASTTRTMGTVAYI